MLVTTNEKLKPIVEAMENILNDCRGIHGIFNIDDPDVREVVEDANYKETIYESGDIKIVFCSYYEYFDVYGLTPLEFAELKGWYDWKKRSGMGKTRGGGDRMSIEDRWIPTTTCMWPKKEGEYLITVKDKHAESGYSVEAVIFDPNYGGNPRWYQEGRDEFFEYSHEFFLPKDVTAWMPYPKPYVKGG